MSRSRYGQIVRGIPTGPALGLGLLLALAGCAGAIAELPVSGPLTPEQIVAAFKGSDFRVKNNAREELQKLPEASRLEIVVPLLASVDAQTRLLLVSELASMSPETTTALLKRLAAEDPDPEVREFAGMVVNEREGGATEEGSGD